MNARIPAAATPPAKSLPIGLPVAVLLGLLLPGTSARAQVPSPSPAEPGERIALVGGTIYPMTGPPIRNGKILFRDGIIEAVGDAIVLPADTRAIDMTGMSIYPGFISTNTALGLTEIGSVRQTVDYQEVGAINPNARVEVALNPESELLPVARANGITTALVVPRGGLLSGTSALIHPDGWTWEQMVVKAPVALHLSWPSLSLNRQPEAKPIDEQIAGQERSLRRIRRTFADARAYALARAASPRPGAPRPEGDVRWEAMLPVFDRRLPVIVQADDARQIRMALDWAEEEGIRLILSGGRDAPLAAERLRERGVPVILGSTLRLPDRDYEPYDEAYTVAARLYQEGVSFCISTGGDAANERNLPYHAAMAWAYGLPHDEALRAITLYPARILQVDDRLGSLEAGKEATLIVTDGDPLEIRSHVVREYIAGRLVDLANKHTRLYEKYRLRPQGAPGGSGRPSR